MVLKTTGSTKDWWTYYHMGRKHFMCIVTEHGLSLIIDAKERNISLWCNFHGSNICLHSIVWVWQKKNLDIHQGASHPTGAACYTSRSHLQLVKAGIIGSHSVHCWFWYSFSNGRIWSALPKKKCSGLKIWYYDSSLLLADSYLILYQYADILVGFSSFLSSHAKEILWH